MGFGLVDELENRRKLTVVLTFILVLLAPAATSYAKSNPADSSKAHVLRSESERLDLTGVALVRLNQGRKNAKLQKEAASATETGIVVGSRITLADGYSFQVDEVWKDGDEIWYRQGKVSRGLPQNSVKSIKPIVKAPESRVEPEKVSKTANTGTAVAEKGPATTWIHLVEGAKFRVDQVQEAPGGFWYSRANLSVFLERERVARIEIDRGESASPEWRGSDWTSGNATIDQLIKLNGSRYGVDPYLVFLVIEQESRFHPRAVSPKGARGLMQLMPGTARRFGVKNSFDIAENIKGGTQYLRELMDMFGGQVNLVLASYNAGEGAVLKYGRNVPPYRETREYVKKIGKRYGLAAREPVADNEPAAPPR